VRKNLLNLLGWLSSGFVTFASLNIILLKPFPSLSDIVILIQENDNSLLFEQSMINKPDASHSNRFFQQDIFKDIARNVT